MTSEQFIEANPTIGFAKATQILEAHGHAFPTLSIISFLRLHPDASKHGMSGSGDPELRETTIDSKTLITWMGY